MSDPQDRIQKLISNHEVVLFMKGSRRLPQCGFSATVVSILDQYVDEYETVNVLTDQDIREGVKAFSNWPTIPQLYVKGEFIGGCDIVQGLDASGDLPKILGSSPAELPTPEITVSDRASETIRAAAEAEAEPGQVLRFEVDPSWRYAMYFDAPRPTDIRVEANGLTLVLDRSSAKKADGVSIDFATGPQGDGFKIANPNEPPVVRVIAPEDLDAMIKAGEKIELIDVREDEEIAADRLEGARKLDAAYAAELETLPKETTLVFYCSVGQRSQVAAEAFLAKGFRKCINLGGGLQAWRQRLG